LVQGPGHCGACHTPRGIGFQEKSLDETSLSYLAGAELDAWYAPSLRGDMRTGLGTWSKTDIVEFLAQGHNRIGTAFGSMTEAINNSTSYLSDSDINAIATYLRSLPATSPQQAVAYDNATTAALRDRPTTQPGRAVYAAACTSCHGIDAKGFTPYMPTLVGNPVVLDAERLDPARRQGNARRLPHAAIPAAVVRSGNRRRHHLHPQRLGQSGDGNHCRSSRQTTPDD
jgi:mono/diheme cytochrome c family protein